jgi:hypothetical protein
MRGQSKVRGLLHHEKVNFQSMPNQARWLGWRWRHHELVAVTIQRRALRVVPLKGEWKKRYRKLMLHYEKKWVFCNWFCNSIFELHWTFATHYIYAPWVVINKLQFTIYIVQLIATRL